MTANLSRNQGVKILLSRKAILVAASRLVKYRLIRTEILVGRKRFVYCGVVVLVYAAEPRCTAGIVVWPRLPILPVQIVVNSNGPSNLRRVASLGLEITLSPNYLLF